MAGIHDEVRLVRKAGKPGLQGRRHPPQRSDSLQRQIVDAEHCRYIPKFPITGIECPQQQQCRCMPVVTVYKLQDRDDLLCQQFGHCGAEQGEFVSVGSEWTGTVIHVDATGTSC